MLLQFSVVFPAEPRWAEGKVRAGCLCPAPGTLEQERARKGGHRGRGAEPFWVWENLSRWAELKVRGDRGQVGWDRGMQVRLQRDLTNIGSGGRRAGSGTERGWGERVSLGKAQLKMQFDSSCEVAKMFGQDVT